MKPISVIFASALMLAIGALPASAQKNVKFALDWVWQSNHAYFTLADDNGHFAKEGLKVKIDRGFGSGDTVNKVAAGTYDIGFADINVLIKFNAKNPKSKVFSFYVVFDSTLSSVIALAKSGIRKPGDLRGKRIAAPVWDNSRILFPIFAKANGFDAGSVKWQSVKPTLRDAMLITGKADAITTWVTTTLLNLQSRGIGRKDVVVMRYSDLGVDLYGSGLVVSEKFAAKNPDVLKGLVRAIIKGTRDSFANPKAAVASIKKRDSLVKDAMELKRFDLVRDLAVLTASVKANGFSHVEPKRLARTIGFVATAMNVANPPAPRDIFRADYLPPAAERKP